MGARVTKQRPAGASKARPADDGSLEQLVPLPSKPPPGAGQQPHQRVSSPGGAVAGGAAQEPMTATFQPQNHSEPVMSPPAPGAAFGLGTSYQPLMLLGRGSTGQAWLCRHGQSGELYVLKLMERPLPPVIVDMLESEVMVQAEEGAGHVGVCQLYEVLLTPTHFALVLEYAAGGTAYQHVESRALLSTKRQELCVPEESARFMFKQLASTIAFLHSKHIVHRDIKLENTLLTSAWGDLNGAGSQARLKLCDFQFAAAWGSEAHGHIDPHLGTVSYLAPELLASRHTGFDFNPEPVDVWACGVWLATMLLGMCPFPCNPGKSPATQADIVLDEQKKRSWRGTPILQPFIDKMSQECVDLLDQMLSLKPYRRISTAGILKHPWVTKALPNSLQAAWDKLEAEQSALAGKISSLNIDQDLRKQRSANVQQMVQDATKPPAMNAAPSLRRIDMRPEAVAGLQAGSEGPGWESLSRPSEGQA